MINKLKKLYTTLIILCIFSLSICGCSEKNNSLIEKITISNIEEGYFVSNISIPEDNKYAIVTLSQENNNTNTSKLFKYEIKNNNFINPIEIKIPINTIVLNAITSLDGSKLYLSLIDNSSLNSDTSIPNFDIAICDLKNNSLENITYIDDINTSSADIILSIDEKNNLVYSSYTEEGMSYIYYGEFNGESYSSSKYSEEINNDYYPVQRAAITPDGNNIIFSNMLNGSIESTYNIQLASKNNGNWFSKTLKGIINDGESDNYVYCISGDYLYYVSTSTYIDNIFFNNNSDADYTFYKAPLESILESTNELTYSKDYSSSKFPLELRNKGDMSSKEGVYYEIFVRSFEDSNNDGVGDFNGITNKLDYLKDLGVDGLWLMPIFSSLSYHGYDVISFYDINPQYGTEEDFQNLINEAHKRDMKIILDFPINHTSNLNKWFTSSSLNPSGKYGSYYRWVNNNDTNEYSPSDKSSWDSTVWHLSGNNYYYGIFSNSMPDLNYNNHNVREDIKNAASKWLNMGIDGFRLDAAIHIYGDNEFKNMNNQLDANIQWWNEFALSCEKINPNVYLVGEAWQKTDLLEDYVQPFDTKFNFTFQESLINSLKNETTLTEDNTSLSKLYENILTTYNKVDSNYIDGIFASNHDQERVMSSLNSIEKAKLAANIYMTLPGNPYIYYGEEIGMLGIKPDENIREAFKWTDSTKSPYAYTMNFNMNDSTPSLESQQKDSNSMYTHYKKIINTRKSNEALSKGDYESLDIDNNSIMAYTRTYNNATCYVIHNLSSSQIELSLDDVSNGNVIFKSSDSSFLKNNIISLDRYSTIIISK